jgi:hypothetical protein
MIRHVIFSLITGAGLMTGAASAEPLIYAYDAIDRRLVSFDAESPGTLLSSVNVTGFLPNESLEGIEFRPSTGELYGITEGDAPASIRLVKINLQSGAVSGVGSGLLMTASDPFGFDIDAASDIVRITDFAHNNFRLDPDDGSLLGMDSPLHYLPGDPDASAQVYILQAASHHVAPAPASTLYGINYETDSLVRIGGINGDPSPDSGALTTVGPLGMTAITIGGGFDIEPATGAGYAALPTASGWGLFKINLDTGAATLMGMLSQSAAGLAIPKSPRIFASGFETP